MRAWLLGTPLPAPLAQEGLDVIDYLRSDAAASQKADRAFRFIYATGDEALTYHFTRPLKKLGVGALTRKGVDVALSVALTGIRGPMKRVLMSMDDDQLRRVAEEIEYRLFPDPHGA